MNKVFLIIVMSIIMLSCSWTDHDNTNSNRFIKVNISDSTVRKVFKQYSNDYGFEGKGVIIANINVEPDTTTCLMMLIMQKEFFEHWLRKRKFVLYDTVGDRIVIISTLLETYFEFNAQKAANDSIIDKYLIPKDGGIYEIWEVEYLIGKDTIIKREPKNKLIY